VFASEPGLPLLEIKSTGSFSSYWEETAANLRRVFESASKQPYVLFLYEFDALARAEYETYGDNYYLVVRCERGGFKP
jgi:AAA+ superfamily predicted ATPase